MRAHQVVLAICANLAIYGLCLPSGSSSLAVVIANTGAQGQDGSGMLWRGSIFPGEEEVVLQGSVIEIWDQIYSLNPDFEPPNAEPENQAKPGAVHEAEDGWEPYPWTNVQGFTKSSDGNYRGHIPNDWKFNSLKCAPMAMGSMTDITRNVDILSTLPGKCGAPSKACRRMACVNTSALYFCNDLETQLDVDCSQAAEFLQQIMNNCCPNQRTSSGLTRSKEGFSVWLGYGNCNHSPDVPPSEYKLGGGNNKKCKPQQSLFMDAKFKWIITAVEGAKALARNPAEETRLRREERLRRMYPFGLPPRIGIPYPGDVDHW
ncbi:hypothetical protein QBC40DRAFT_260298 [Triangularia verruculosa]|uniref:Uncharacterized protein n=1 Tax=Triangularia verruculosa TaxID=2587418 RepID=A0AAN6X5R1_9PEZI|nr:hypothetical protein QBC40DRAFT_260298 [Triangularia verruculosa]